MLMADTNLHFTIILLFINVICYEANTKLM